MTLSRIEANWIASMLLSDAEQERERAAERRTAWLALLYPPLKLVRPTERIQLLRRASQLAAKEPLILIPTITGMLFAALYIWVWRQSRPAWSGLLPDAIVIAYFVACYVRTRSILSTALR